MKVQSEKKTTHISYNNISHAYGHGYWCIFCMFPEAVCVTVVLCDNNGK